MQLNTIDNMKFVYIIILMAMNCILFASESILEKVLQDETLIVPGCGAERVLLSENIANAIDRYGNYRFKYSRPQKISELFKEIFKVDGNLRIYFDEIYYNDEKKFALFVFKKRIVAVAGFNQNKITEDSIQLAKGLDYFIFSYGNKHMIIVENAGNKICIYPDRGVALIDDGADDSIDMYIVFTIMQKR